jgi:hypothetical protein
MGTAVKYSGYVDVVLVTTTNAAAGLRLYRIS